MNKSTNMMNSRVSACGQLHMNMFLCLNYLQVVHSVEVKALSSSTYTSGKTLSFSTEC